MPIYEYSCKDCGANFEAMTTMAQRDKMDCPECQSKRTLRQASTFCCSVEGGTGAGRSSGKSAARGSAKSSTSQPACASGG